MFIHGFQRQVRYLALGAACVLLSACAIGKQDAGNYLQIADGAGRILVSAPVYAGVEPTRIGFVDSGEREEYALFRGAGGQAEMVYMEVRPEALQKRVIEFNKLIVDTVPLWRFNQGEAPAFGSSFDVKNALGLFWAQPYRQTVSGRDCVGFFGNWDIEPADGDLRPRHTLFGYHCVPRGQTLTEADARAFVAALDIRGISVPMRIKTAYDLRAGDAPLPPKSEQIANLVIAQDGIAGGVSGIPSFPLLASRPARLSDACRPNC